MINFFNYTLYLQGNIFKSNEWQFYPFIVHLICLMHFNILRNLGICINELLLHENIPFRETTFIFIKGKKSVFIRRHLCTDIFNFV